MFERFTEKARRVVFFARYEASHYGSHEIDTEHILLGLLREEKSLSNRFLRPGANESIRKQIDGHITWREKIPTSVDLPLSENAKTALVHSAEAADELGHCYIGTEHLLLGLLRMENCFATELLRNQGAEQTKVREALAKMESMPRDPTPVPVRPRQSWTVEIHGVRWDGPQVAQLVNHYRQHPWHWEKKLWSPRDIVTHRGHGTISFDLSLASSPEFELVKYGWKRDYCLICRWELSDTHTGYTNGRDWLCLECYEKFWARPDFFAAGYGDLT